MGGEILCNLEPAPPTVWGSGRGLKACMVFVQTTSNTSLVHIFSVHYHLRFRILPFPLGYGLWS